MIIYYPTYYLVPVAPVMSLDDEDYNDRYSEDYRFGYNMDEDETYNVYRNINTNIFVDIFENIDEEYVNESTK
ncbi:MAG: hypothetical protein MUO60_12045 [Clostridiaceae bacterium]|nr:hypothetical protein [Clostridiaceae bacterium]